MHTMRKKILHIEDDEDTRDLVGALLKKEGYSVSSFSCGPDCLDVLDKCDVDLILLDVMLPDMSGFDILKRIRQGASKSSPKVAFLSMMPVSDDALSDMKQDGVVDYIMKPFDNEDLVKRIGKVFEVD
jgi:two-component system OmpR family response regulator